MEETKEHRKKMAKIIAKAWSDLSFRDKLLADPKGVLEEQGVAVPEGLEVKVLVQTDKTMYIIIPFRSPDQEGGSWQTADDAYDLPCIRCS